MSPDDDDDPVDRAEQAAREWEAKDDESDRTLRGELRKAAECLEIPLSRASYGEPLTGGDVVRLNRVSMKIQWLLRRLG